MKAGLIILGIFTALIIVGAVLIIERMGENINHLNAENKALKIRIEELEAKQPKKSKKGEKECLRKMK